MKSVAVEQILAGKSLDVQVETKIKGQLGCTCWSQYPTCPPFAWLPDQASHICRVEMKDNPPVDPWLFSFKPKLFTKIGKGWRNITWWRDLWTATLSFLLDSPPSHCPRSAKDPGGGGLGGCGGGLGVVVVGVVVVVVDVVVVAVDLVMVVVIKHANTYQLCQLWSSC